MAWRVAKSLETLRHQFNARYPARSTVSDGGIGDAAHASRSSDHNPWVRDGSMGIVTARDFTHDPANGMDIDRLTDELAASRDPRIKYIIANGYILDSRPGHNPWRWVRYYGSNPHNKHFHLSVMPSKALYDDTRPWNLPSLKTTGGGGASPGAAPQQEDDMTPAQAEQLDYAVRIGAENQRRIDRAIAIATENQRRISDTLRLTAQKQGVTAGAIAEALAPRLTDDLLPLVETALQRVAGADNKDQAREVVAELGRIIATGNEGQN